MTVSADYLQYVLEQLAALEGLSCRRMFGGAGLYSDRLFFGLISRDTLYLRVDDCNRGEFTARGMQPFRPFADRPHFSVSYFEVPAEVLEEAGQLAQWARRSIEVAQRAPPPGEKAARLKRAARAAPRRARPGR